MRPHIAPFTQWYVRLPRMTHNHHSFNQTLDGYQRASERRARATRRRRIECTGFSQRRKRATDAAHDIAAFNGDFSSNRARSLVHQPRCIRVRQTQFANRRTYCDNRLLGRDVAVECRIGIRRLEWNDLRVAIATVCRDDHACTGVVHAIRQSLVGEASKHRRIHDAEPLRCFSPRDLLGDVGQVECDPITRLEPQLSQRECTARDIDEQLFPCVRVGHNWSAATTVLRLVPPIAFYKKRWLVAKPREHVAIDFVEAGVRQRAGKPAIERCLIVIECARPRTMRRRIRARNHSATRRVEAVPPVVVAACEPGVGWRIKPVDFARGNIAVKFTRVPTRMVAQAQPIGARANGIELRRLGADGRCSHERPGITRQSTSRRAHHVRSALRLPEECTRSGDRTRTTLRSRDFKSRASANFAIRVPSFPEMPSGAIARSRRPVSR